MERPGDDAILELLDESELMLPPTAIALNIDYAPNTVKKRVGPLSEHGLLERAEEVRGYYRITDKGRAYLRGELDRDDLEPDE